MKMDYWWQGLLLVGAIICALAIICSPMLPVKYDQPNGFVFAFGLGCMLIGFGNWIALNNKSADSRANEPTSTIYKHDKITKTLIVIGIIMVVVCGIGSFIVMSNY